MRKLYFLILTILTSLATIAQGPLGMIPRPPKGPAMRMYNSDGTGQQRVVSQPGFFLENFEDCPGSPDFTFPGGWLTTPNPTDAGDLWRVGTISKEGEPMRGSSGTKYAFILGTGKTHDAWAVSPAIEMVAGQDYDISFYTIMFSGDNFEGLEVTVLPAQSITATPAARFTVVSEKDTDGNWFRFKKTFTPTVSGNYYIGIHSNAGGDLNYGTVIDDLKVTHGAYPVFNGDTFLEMGEKGSLDAYIDATYEFYNLGEADLKVSFEPITDGIQVLTPESVAEPSETGTAKFRLAYSTPGEFSGLVKVTTNDPSVANFTMKITATIKESRLTGYNFENFENGGPEGWTLCRGSVNTADYGGHDGSSRAFYTTSYYTMLPENPEGVGFTTHYVEMGDNPSFSFWYKLFNSNFFGDPAGPTGADVPRIRVLATDDFGTTWKEVYIMEPGGKNEHKAVEGWQNVKVSLPQLAGKTCAFRLLFNHASGDVMDAMMKTFTVLVDDVSAGTLIPRDVKAGYLKGATAVTPGAANTYTVEIINSGAEALSKTTVNLVYATDNSMLKSTDITDFQPGAKQTVTFQ